MQAVLPQNSYFASSYAIVACSVKGQASLIFSPAYAQYIILQTSVSVAFSDGHSHGKRASAARRLQWFGNHLGLSPDLAPARFHPQGFGIIAVPLESGKNQLGGPFIPMCQTNRKTSVTSQNQEAAEGNFRGYCKSIIQAQNDLVSTAGFCV